MPKYLTVMETAEKWGLNKRTVANYCATGKIPGVEKPGREWLIPEDAEKPNDHRAFNGRKSEELLPLPVSISDFKDAATNFYYVDKTLLIRDILDELPRVALFTRPRRFGKTLNMSMLRVFFEKTNEDTSIYFRDKAIWKCGKKYTSHQGKYPVISLTFKDCDFESWELTRKRIFELLRKEFRRHKELEESTALSQDAAEYYNWLVHAKWGDEEHTLSAAVQMLCIALHEHYGIAPLILIDEYDMPIQRGYKHGFYNEAALFMRNLFSECLKDNSHLSFGLMTGVLRIAKESIFSGLNNLRVYSILDNAYSSYFGFTLREVGDIANYYGVPEKLTELYEWYNGYIFGDVEIFNPWSVINYFASGKTPGDYWTSTSSNDILQDLLTGTDAATSQKLCDLLEGRSIWCRIDTDTIFPELESNPEAIYSILFLSGYLKVTRKERVSGRLLCELCIPNKELHNVFEKEIMRRLEKRNIVESSVFDNIQRALITGDKETLQSLLRTYLLHSASYYDTPQEVYYQGLLLGLSVVVTDYYYVTSNRESGDGRYDIMFEPKTDNLPGILIELKSTKDTKTDLTALAQSAIQQIEDNSYAVDLQVRDISPIFAYGVACCQKQVAVEVKEFK